MDVGGMKKRDPHYCGLFVPEIATVAVHVWFDKKRMEPKFFNATQGSFPVIRQILYNDP